MENVIFEYYIGDTYSRDFTISDYSSEITEVYFSVKKNNSDKRTVLQKKLDNGITLTDVQYDDEGNITSRTYNILINADDTEDMQVDFEYPFDIEIITPGVNSADIKKTIISGIFKLKSATTRKYNE
jgi:hypothetical protein